MNRPNILLILTDQQRYDSLGCYGSRVVPTPNLDRLAGEGLLFENCYVNNPICTPSRASIWTGKPLPGHGVYRLNDLLPESEKLFPTRLREKGYRTALFGKLHVSSRTYELEHRHPGDGFDIYENSIAPYTMAGTYAAYLDWLREQYPDFYAKLCREGRKVGNFPEKVHFTRWVAERTIDFIRDSTPESPFFCCMSIFDPHDPYNDYPLEMEALINKKELDRIPDYRSDNEPEAVRREREHGYLGSFRNLTLEQIRAIRRGYYCSVAFLDQEIGHVLKTLDEKGLRDDTLVLFLSDHGDMACERQLLAKGAFLYDPCVKVPFILRYPAVIKEAGRIPDLVQPHDVAATVLTQAGYSRRELDAFMPDSLDVIGRLTGGKEDSSERYAVCLYRNTGICDTKLYWDPAIHATMLRTKDFKLIVYHNQPGAGRRPEGELYDMRSDPGETVNRWDDPRYADSRFDLVTRLMDWMVAEDVRYNGSRGGELFTPRSAWSTNNPI